MTRTPVSATTELVGKVMRELPVEVRRVLGNVDFVIDTDPVWMGLHFWTQASYGRSYRNTSHCVWEYHQTHLPRDKRSATVVLLDGDEKDREVILHELGHVLDERIGFDHPKILPIGEYAATHPVEAFATAFQSWLTLEDRGHGFYSRETLQKTDPRAFAFFETFNPKG